jgi:hypothetical protein
MSLLPPSTNHLYRGSLASVWFHCLGDEAQPDKPPPT